MGKNRLTNRSNKSKPKWRQDLDEFVDQLLKLSSTAQPSVAKLLENQKEIEKVLGKIRKIEGHVYEHTIDNRASADIVENFIKWTRDNGAEFKGCSIATFDGYDLGFRVDTDIQPSSLVIAVPRILMLTLDKAKGGIMESLLQTDKILSNMPNVALAMLLLLEKHSENSFWKPYIDILPNKYNTTLYFTVDELEELKGSPTLEMALKHIKNIVRQYAYFHKLFNTSDDPVSKLLRNRFTYNEYCWAVSTIMTRQNTISFEDNDGGNFALIPLWDMCNHTNGTITTAYNPTLQRSECLALKNFKAGEQLFIFYGARSNADFFIHNGFIYEENEHDGYWIRLGISKSDPLYEKRTKLLHKINVITCDFFVQKGSCPIDGSLLAFSRIFNMNEDQLQNWLDGEKSADLCHIDCALDNTLEKKSWSFLLNRLKLLLATYKTSLEEDEKLLKNDGQSPNKVLAIKMRTIEKRIITDAVDYVEQHIQQ